MKIPKSKFIVYDKRSPEKSSYKREGEVSKANGFDTKPDLTSKN